MELKWLLKIALVSFSRVFSVASSLFKKALIFTEYKNHVLLADVNINIPQQL